MPFSLDVCRPARVGLPKKPAETTKKKPRLAAFTTSGSVAIKISAKPCHEDRQSTFGPAGLCHTEEDMGVSANRV